MLKHTLQVALFNAHKLSAQIEEKLIESEGEVTPEINELLALKNWDQGMLESETDLLAMSLERMGQLAQYYKDQIEHLEKLVKGLEQAEERMALEIKGMLEKLNLEAVEGQYKRFSLRRTPPKVEILDESAIPQEFKELKITEMIKKKAIGEALKAGEELHWARLTSGHSLSISTAKPKQLKESENE
jgi:hypothetical protein